MVSYLSSLRMRVRFMAVIVLSMIMFGMFGVVVLIFAFVIVGIMIVMTVPFLVVVTA